MQTNTPNPIPLLSLPLGDLLTFGAQLHADSTPQALLDEVAETLHHTTGCPYVYILLRHADTDMLEAAVFVGLPAAAVAHLRAHPVQPAAYQAVLQPAFQVSESFLLPAEHDALLAGVPDDPEPPAHTARLLVPLRSRAAQLQGLIVLAVPADLRALIVPHIQVLEAIARQAGLALENVRLADRAARLLAREHLLVQLGRDVTSSLDLETILERAIARLHPLLRHSSITLCTAQGELELIARTGPPVSVQAVPPTLPSRGLLTRVVHHGASYFSNRADAEELGDLADLLFDALAQPCSVIAVPLWSGGQVIGTLNTGARHPDAFSYDDVDLLEAIAAQISGPIASARLYQESQHLAAQVQRRADQLTVLTSLGGIATSTLNLEQMLSEVTRRIREGFGYTHVEVYLLEAEGGDMVLYAQAGWDNMPPGRRQPITLGVMGRAVRSGLVQHVNDVQQDNDFYSRASTIRSELCVPIATGGRVLGLINLESETAAAFTGDDVAVLETAADILAGAIEHARLYHRAQAAAVLEERNRLARELHDSVTQQLFSITLTTQAVRTQMEKNPARAAVQLERLQETAAAALAEMRALIAQLRPPALTQQGLVAALRQHVASLSRREELRIELRVTGDERAAQGHEQALYRIAQEALNNVIKHAHATSVRVQLVCDATQVQLSVQDDGNGFDVAAPPTGTGRSMGLISMQERAAEIGGTLTIHSTPGSGTTVRAQVPRASRT